MRIIHLDVMIQSQILRNQLPFWPGFLKSSFLSFLSKRKEIGRKGITWRALLKASFKVADLG